MKKIIMALAAVLILAACGSKNTTKSADITGKWEIKEAMGLKTTKADAKPFINFEKDGTVTGNASVNIFSGSYKLSGNKLTLSNIGITKMMGINMEVEDSVISAINSVASVQVKDSNILVQDSKGKTVMVLSKFE